jgi:hypothetical protein
LRIKAEKTEARDSRKEEKKLDALLFAYHRSP